MENTKIKQYNIGLDIGTNSVGWAAVECDTQKIIRKGNKKLWGVRLFDSSVTAEARRISRGTRRRYDRRRYRIHLLQQEFQNEMNKVDPNFFVKLKETFFNEDDKVNKKNPLSLEEKKLVTEFQQKYKTIYHLRKELIDNKEKKDIRLVYLAIHHLIKYRGNFLYKGDSLNLEKLNIEEILQELIENIVNLCTNFNISEEYQNLFSSKKIQEILLEPSKLDRKVYLKETLSEFFPVEFVSEFIKMINGNKFQILKMLSIEAEEKLEISFEDTDFEDKYNNLENVLGEKIKIVELMKQLYDSIFLKKLFQDSNSSNISSLMVEKYNNHKEDLRFLKELLNYNREIYRKVFKTKKEVCLYERYVNNELSYDEFIKELEKYLPSIFEQDISPTIRDKYISKYQSKIENGTFLPRITSKENGKYPYQLNKEELIKILENQGQYYNFLLEKMNDKYKIVTLLEFRIPYYIGPLTSSKYSKNAWMIRKKENVKITPYNFDEVVDKENTAEQFIKRMVSHCTYLLDEYALPNQSILYSKYKVMNELKQIRVNNQKLTCKMQQKIINELFCTNSGAITDKKFKEYLIHCKDFDMYDDFSITGYSAENRFANNMQSYIDFFGENGIFKNTDYTEEDADLIIEWVTIFEDKDILENKIRREFKNLSENQINQILKKNYSGWGSLSKKLLTEKYYLDNESGLKKSIFDLLEEKEENFIQILNNNKYKFQKMIDENNHIDKTKKINYSLVEKLATSPANKRGIYQALKIVEELVDYIGNEPKYISVEMSRGKEKSERKDDKKKYLLNLYEASKNQIENYNKLMPQLKKQEKIDSQKLFLYFIQEGKSLYSGKPLNIEDLNSYEIDHIVPRTLIKDDSIDNKALVYANENQTKAASFTLPKEYRTNSNFIWWEHLRKIGLISKKKFDSLRRSEYKDEMIEGFINRQLVETRQIIKHVANILNTYYSNSKTIYLKANLSHLYREKYELFKFREINDFHHAHDAYLAAVLGEYKEKYLNRKITFEDIKELNKTLRERKEYNKFKYGYVINSLDSSLNVLLKQFIDDKTGEVLFDAEKFNAQVEDNLYHNDILVSKKVEFRTGEFYNQTKYKKGSSGVPLKDNLPTSLYGSYKNIYPSYGVVVKYTFQNKEEQRMISMPIYVIEKAKTNSEVINNYVKKLLNLSDNDVFTILNKKIPFYTLLNLDGQICYLVGASDKVEVCNAKELCFSKKAMKKYKYAFNRLLNNKKDSISDIKYEKDLEEIILYIVNKIDKEYKLYQNLVPKLNIMLKLGELLKMSLENKEKTIKELLNLLNCKSDTADFKHLSCSSTFGRKKGKNIAHAKVICSSVTGIKENTYEF